MNGIYVVALAVCACLGYAVALYQRRLQNRDKPAAPPQGSSAPALEPQLVKQFLRRLAETARANAGTDAADWGWLDNILGELDSGAADPQAVLAAAERLMEMIRQLEDQLAEAHAHQHTPSADYWQRLIDLELRRRFAELRRYDTPFSVLRLRAELTKAGTEGQELAAAGPEAAKLEETIAAALREVDFCVPDAPGRFTAILPATRLIQAEQAAHRVRQVVESCPGETPPVRLFAGVAQALAHDDAQSLLGRADEALQAASPQSPCMVHNGQKCRPAQGRLRTSRRYRAGGTIRVAPYEPDKPLEEHRFQEVECKDLSQGGLAFLSDTNPAGYELLVVFPNRKEGTLMVAAVRSRSKVYVDGKRFWRIGCQFTRRLGKAAGLV